MKKTKKQIGFLCEINILEDDSFMCEFRAPQGQLVGVCLSPLEVHDFIVEISKMEEKSDSAES